MFNQLKHYTISNCATALFKEKGSKHLGYSFSINSQSKVSQCVSDLKQKHPKANHVCFAYRLLANNQLIEYASDDGEPKNTAGAPILGQLKSFELLNTLVCVVRYFGGTKLGVSGLINAYKSTAKLVLTDSGKIALIKKYNVIIKIESTNVGRVLKYLSKNKITIANHSYAKNQEFTIKTSADELKKIKTNFDTIAQIIWDEI